MEEKNNIIVAFTEKAESALLDIEKKYGLEESKEEITESFKQDKPSKINVITNLIREFVKNNKSEKDLITSLQKDLGVSSQIAQQISKEILDNIVPFLKKVTEENLKDRIFVKNLLEGKEQKNTTPTITHTSTFLNNKTNEKIADKKEKPIPSVPNLKEQKKIINKVPKKTVTPEKQKSRGSDKYREPID